MNEHFPHSHRPSASPALVIVATLILAGCDATRSTAAPQPTTSVPESPSYGQSAALGSSNVFIPNTNGFHESGYAGWQLTPIQVPGGTWTHVEVSGGVSYTRNPDCYVASNPCGAPLAGSTTGPLHHGGSSRISVAHQAEGGSRSTYRLFPRDGDAQTAMSAYALRYHATPQTIWVQRHMAHSGTWDPIAGTWRGFEYYLGGSQTVTVYEVPKPLRVVAPAAVTPGGTGTFRAEIVGPFDIRMPAGAGGGYFPLVRWTYMRGDTLAHQTGRAVNVTACNDLLECEFKPEVPGRMYVVTYPGGEHVSERSEIVRVQERELKLTCPETVVRGQTMTCTVAAVPSGTLTDIRWLFQDNRGHTIHGPADALVWSGPMVVGGVAIATAILDGVAVGDTSLVTVRARDWTSPLPGRREIAMRCEQETNVCFQLYPPTHDRHLGTHIFQPAGISTSLVADRARTVDEGPNAGWSYLAGSDSPVKFELHLIILNAIMVEPEADDAARAFWAAQPQTPECTPSAVLAMVLAHERHHADLFDRNRSILDAEVEAEIAFVGNQTWLDMLGLDGEILPRWVSRLSVLTGGQHRLEDGFPPTPCAPNLRRNNEF